MRKIGFIVLSLLLLAGLASAQVPTSGNVFFGYSYLDRSPLSASSLSNAVPGETSRVDINGWEGTFEGKALPWVGLVADVSEHYGYASSCAVAVSLVTRFSGVGETGSGWLAESCFV
jgi:hypothetical protein